MINAAKGIGRAVKQYFANRDFLRKPLLHIILIATLGLIAYSNTFTVPFQFDDDLYIVENPLIKDLDYLREPSKAEGLALHKVIRAYGRTRYVAYLSFWANFKANGLDVGGYHAVNLSIHILNALLFYALLRLTLRTPRVMGRAEETFIPLFAALLFALHPVQTEAVTYISQRFTSLAALFYFGSLVFYAKWRLKTERQRKEQVGKSSQPPFTKSGRGGIYPYFLSLLCAVLAMKTKENAFTLPVAIVLYEAVFFSGPPGKRAFRLLPFLFILPIVPLSVMGLDRPLSEAVFEATKTQQAISRHDYLLTQFPVIVKYLGLLALPFNQNLDYDYPVVRSFLEPRAFLSFLFLFSLFSLSVFLLRRTGKARLTSFWMLWFFLALSVESSIISLADVIFEHRLYLPSAGFYVAAAVAAAFVLGKERLRKAGAVFSVLVILALAWATFARNAVWRSQMSLWQDAVEKSPHKARPYNNLGRVFAESGMTDRAIELFDAAIRLDPKQADAYNNIALAYRAKGMVDEAIENFETAIEIEDSFTARYNLGVTYHGRGLLDKAIEHYRAAAKLDNNNYKLHYNLALAYLSKGLIESAEKHYRMALDLGLCKGADPFEPI